MLSYPAAIGTIRQPCWEPCTVIGIHGSWKSRDRCCCQCIEAAEKGRFSCCKLIWLRFPRLDFLAEPLCSLQRKHDGALKLSCSDHAHPSNNPPIASCSKHVHTPPAHQSTTTNHPPATQQLSPRRSFSSPLPASSPHRRLSADPSPPAHSPRHPHRPTHTHETAAVASITIRHNIQPTAAQRSRHTPANPKRPRTGQRSLSNKEETLWRHDMTWPKGNPA